MVIETHCGMLLKVIDKNANVENYQCVSNDFELRSINYIIKISLFCIILNRTISISISKVCTFLFVFPLVFKGRIIFHSKSIFFLIYNDSLYSILFLFYFSLPIFNLFSKSLVLLI